MKTTPRLASTLGLSLVLAAGAFAQTTPSTDARTLPSKYGDAPISKLSHGDKNFVEEAAKSGMTEIAISQIALTRASNPQVKEFAQMMVTDHTAASTELGSLAAAKGVVLPKEPNTEKWSKRDAKDFDQEYMDKMVNDHEEAVKLFEKQSKKGEDAELTAFASKTLPKLQHHLTQARDLKKLVK